MSCAKYARILADYISDLPLTNISPESANKFSYNHIGALFTDVVLQAGINYQSVVKPRVQQILLKYPEDITLTKFQAVIAREGLAKVINWSHEVKLDRFQRLVNFSIANQVNSVSDLKAFFYKRASHEAFLALNGFGPKSLDYILKLLNIDSVAVDRHIYAFVKMANIEIIGYHETKKIVEFAADFLNISRSAVDQIIWNYMSQKKYLISREDCQIALKFPSCDSGL